MTALATAIRNAPFAFHSEAEAADLADQVASNPAHVADELDRDAAVHECCDNWIKAGVIRKLAARVRAL